MHIFINLHIKFHLLSEDYGQVAEDEDRETEDDLDEEDEEYDSGGSGVAMTPPGSLHIPSDILTFYHPDSPGAGRRHLAKKNSVVEGLIDPERDIYAIPSQVTMKFKSKIQTEN